MLPTKRELTFRPSSRPLLRAPLTVRSAGQYRLNRLPECNRPRGFTQLFWIAEGKLLFRRKGREFAAKAGEGFFYGAEEPHHVEPQAGGARYHWITFDGNFAGEFLAEAGRGLGPLPLGECPEFRFRELIETVGSPDLIAEHRAAAIGYDLLLRFGNCGNGVFPRGAGDTAGDVAEQARRRMEQRYADAAFGIEALAEELACHRATLFRLFRARHRMSPVAYLQRVRLREALHLLRETNWPVHEVGRRCGFADAAYFTRTVRLATGDPPRKVRERGRETTSGLHGSRNRES